MINIYDLREFYSLTIDVILNRIYTNSSQIILSGRIDEKIQFGLNLSALWVTSHHLERRLKAMDHRLLLTILFQTTHIRYMT